MPIDTTPFSCQPRSRTRAATGLHLSLGVLLFAHLGCVLDDPDDPTGAEAQGLVLVANATPVEGLAPEGTRYSRFKSAVEDQYADSPVANASTVGHQSALDVPAGYPDGEQTFVKMTSGRIANLPVSWYGHFDVGLSGASGSNRLRAITLCSGTEDTVLIVDIRNPDGSNRRVFFNDDSSLAGGNGKGSYIHAGSWPTGAVADVYVASAHRATAYCSLWLDKGSGWRFESADRWGGTLVDVGPLRSGDSIAVESQDYGASSLRTDTQMLLFEGKVSGYSTLPPIYNDNYLLSFDPTVSVTGTGWQSSSSSFVLVGKTHRDASENAGIETRVALRHSPEVTASFSFDTGSATGAAATMVPGRYYAYLYSRIESPVGDTALAANPVSMPWTFFFDHAMGGGVGGLEIGTCWGNSETDDIRGPFYLGQLNDFAFRLEFQRLESGSWHTVSYRIVPRGAFGGTASDGWQKFVIEAPVDEAGQYRLKVVEPTAGLQWHTSWRYTRNPQASELKVVSHNQLFWKKDHAENHHRNSSNLLATRGSIERSSQSVIEPFDQAPMQWDADIIAWQELHRTLDYFWGAEVFVEEAERRGSQRWAYIKGTAESYYDGIGVDHDTDGFGWAPVFVRQQLWPNQDSQSSIVFSGAAREAAGCTNLDSYPTYSDCPLAGYEDPGGVSDGYSDTFDVDNAAVIGRVSVKRGSGPRSNNDRPIAVFNVHLEHAAVDGEDRAAEIDSLIDRIDALLAAEPQAFNRAGNSGPRHYQNRIMILGDMNMNSHSCGEHYWLIKKLRDHYGWAVDAAMAAPGSVAYKLGMYDSGLGLQSVEVNETPSISYDIPVNYQHYSPSQSFAYDLVHPPWQAAVDLSDESVFPWWASSWRGRLQGYDPNYSERYDAIFLVGRGWAYDDPVLTYTVMSDRTAPSPINKNQRGVEMWPGSGPGTVTDNYELSYRPNHDTGGGTHRGAPALKVDHKPIGARLRVWER